MLIFALDLRPFVSRKNLATPCIDNPTTALYPSRRVHVARCLDFLRDHDQSLTPSVPALICVMKVGDIGNRAPRWRNW